METEIQNLIVQLLLGFYAFNSNGKEKKNGETKLHI